MHRMGFGVFLAPFHPVGQHPTLALERDLELIAHLDALGYDEAWIGEHHSAGYVAPQFQGQVDPPTRSRDWAAGNREEFMNSAVTAVMTQVQKHHEERAAKGAAS